MVPPGFDAPLASFSLTTGDGGLASRD